MIASDASTGYCISKHFQRKRPVVSDTLTNAQFEPSRFVAYRLSPIEQCSFEKCECLRWCAIRLIWFGRPQTTKPKSSKRSVG